MKLDIQLQELQDQANEQMQAFLAFIESQNSHKMIISIELTEKERLALEFYAYQSQVEVRDLIESSIRNHFSRFFESIQ